MTLRKLLFHIFHFTVLSLSDTTLIVIPSLSKMVSGVTYILFTAWLTAQQIKQTFIVAIKTMVYFIRFLVVKLVNSSVIFVLLKKLTPSTTTLSALYLSFNKIQLRSHYIIFYFSRSSVRYDQRRWKSPLNFSITV